MLGKLRVLVIVAAAAALASAACGAWTEENGAGDRALDFDLSIGLGAETFTQSTVPVSYRTYQKLALAPDLSIGKFGIGLDLALHYTFTGGPDNESFEVRREDWVPSEQTFQAWLGVYLAKIAYVRYGFKGDPLFVKLGSIDDAVLGNGFIMGGYDNTVFLPDLRIFGLSFDLDGALFDFPYVGIETFVGNLAQLDVMGFRPFVRPLAFTQVPVIRNLQVGFTLAMDRKPGLYSEEPGAQDAGAVILYGGDLRLPILANPMLSLVAFSDLAVLHNSDALGGDVGLGGRLFGFLSYGASVRVLGRNFVPDYFGPAYDLFRYAQYQIVESTSANIEPMVGWVGSLGFSFFDEALSFTARVDGPFVQPDPGNPANYLNYPHLYAVFTLGEGLVPNLSLQAIYDKRAINEWGDLISGRDALIQARLNYSIGVAVLSFLYKLRYDAGATPDPWIIESGIESTIKLF